MSKVFTESSAKSTLGVVLRVLVFTAAAVVITGGIIYLCKYGLETPSYSTFHGEDSMLNTPVKVAHSALTFDSKAIIQLGILLLMIIPFVRVILYFLLFIFQRDWLYCGITMSILIVLVYSLTGGVQ